MEEVLLGVLMYQFCHLRGRQFLVFGSISERPTDHKVNVYIQCTHIIFFPCVCACTRVGSYCRRVWPAPLHYIVHCTWEYSYLDTSSHHFTNHHERGKALTESHPHITNLHVLVLSNFSMRMVFLLQLSPSRSVTCHSISMYWTSYPEEIGQYCDLFKQKYLAEREHRPKMSETDK